MQSNIENFYRSVSQNPALLSKITTGANTPDEFIDRAVAVAKDEGYAIDRQEAKTWIDSQISAKSNGELSDVQLEAVAGGKGPVSTILAVNAEMAKHGGASIAPVANFVGNTNRQVTSWLSNW